MTHTAFRECWGPQFCSPCPCFSGSWCLSCPHGQMGEGRLVPGSQKGSRERSVLRVPLPLLQDGPKARRRAARARAASGPCLWLCEHFVLVSPGLGTLVETLTVSLSDCAEITPESNVKEGTQKTPLATKPDLKTHCPDSTKIKTHAASSHLFASLSRMAPPSPLPPAPTRGNPRLPSCFGRRFWRQK